MKTPLRAIPMSKWAKNFRLSNPFVLAALGLGFLMGCLLSNDKVSRGSVIENEMAGVIVTTDGNPTVGARVRLFMADSGSLSGGGAIKEAQTDLNGRFRFSDLVPGAYTLLGQKDLLYAFHDSILIPVPVGNKSDSISLAPDTLKATGSIGVQVKLKAGDDPSSIRGEVLGTSFNARATTNGDLSMAGMPAGRLRIRFTSTLPGYKPLIVTVPVTPGAQIQADTLDLPYQAP
jgi:Carboxypeptidase regulatory-like domain